jgi:GNAT superfamily N-acetyltransferase
VTDRATYGRLCDVYVLDDYRGRGLGTWLIGFALSHPDLAGLKRITLGTRDAHDLYAKFGFERGLDPNGMQLRNPDPYLQANSLKTGKET